MLFRILSLGNSFIRLLSDCRAKRWVLIISVCFHFTSRSFPPQKFLLNSNKILRRPCTETLLVEYVRMIFTFFVPLRYFTLIWNAHYHRSPVDNTSIQLSMGPLHSYYSVFWHPNSWYRETSEYWGYYNSQVLLCSE